MRYYTVVQDGTFFELLAISVKNRILKHLGGVLGRFWEHFGRALGSFWEGFGRVWQHFWHFPPQKNVAMIIAKIPGAIFVKFLAFFVKFPRFLRFFRRFCSFSQRFCYVWEIG